MRLIFMGTPDYSVPVLDALVDAGHEIVAVYSQPPRPAGRRGLETLPSPVHARALERGLTVLTPRSLKDAAEQGTFRNWQAEAAVVVAYGLILPESILSGTRLGAWNGHASLLPRWRGAAPIQRAIMAGDERTGVMIMAMDKGLDTGPVALTAETMIGQNETAGELHDRLSRMTASLMREAMDTLSSGSLTTTPQPDEGVTYAAKISKEEAHLSFSGSAESVHNKIRGLSPFPGAWCQLPLGGKQERVKILRSELVSTDAGTGEPGSAIDDRLTFACGTGAVRFIEVQRAGSKALRAEEFLRGMPVPAGTKAG